MKAGATGKRSCSRQKLKAPISWKDTDPDIAAFLDKLQGNILKGHGRNNVVYLFCRFRQDLKAEALAFLRAQIGRVRSAKDQLLAAEHKRLTGQKDTKPFVSVFLSKSGYDYFGVAHGHQPADHAFQGGMAAARLGDPAQAEWDSHLRNPHALILIAVGSPDEAQTETTELLNMIGEIGDVGAGLSGEIIGNQFFNAKGNGVENFGYVDGRSQRWCCRGRRDRGRHRHLAGHRVPGRPIRRPRPGRRCGSLRLWQLFRVPPARARRAWLQGP